MNKELILKYKAEFEHCLSGGKLLYCSNSSNVWYAVIGDNIWSINSSDLKIVIDDEYVELRKALAEGKTIQYYRCIYTHEMCCSLDKYEWTDLQTSIFDKPIKNYRIKQEESEFKAGDWVIDLRDNTVKQVINPNSPAALSDYVKWKPQPGEWCWFYDELQEINATYLSQFQEMDDDGYVAMDDAVYECCEPFIGELPTYLQQPE